MDLIEKIRQLLLLVSKNDLAELEVEEPNLRIKIKTNKGARYSAPPLPAPAEADQLQAQQPAVGGPSELPVEAAAAVGREKLLEISSPMVGTFYRAPGEGAEPYVTIGMVVEPDTVVCVVEAMKVMNEVKAELSGEVVEILVQNAEPVEFGQVLFLLRPGEE